MSPIIKRPTYTEFLLQSAAFIALVGATMFMQTASAADPGAATPKGHHQTMADMKGETVEQRIDGLHKSLNITANEEASWTGVAQAMRENDSAMQKLVAARNAEAPKTISAVEDLKTYETFTQAHVDGLKNLITAFETLYNDMPASQKIVADHVFQSFGHSAKTAAR